MVVTTVPNFACPETMPPHLVAEYGPLPDALRCPGRRVDAPDADGSRGSSSGPLRVTVPPRMDAVGGHLIAVGAHHPILLSVHLKLRRRPRTTKSEYF